MNNEMKQSSAARHTPGPWHRNIKPARKYSTVFAGRNIHVAVIQSQGLEDDEVEANCDLIAAAPDMLDALKLADQVLRLGSCREAYLTDNPTRTIIEAAIAKAEGRE